MIMATSGPINTLPLVIVTQHRENSGPIIRPSDLPSARFKYSVWHDLENNVLNANELHNPRIRKGPYPELREREEGDSNDVESGSNRQWSKRRRNFRIEFENWEEVKVANLSYQNLGDSFQVNNFMHVVGRLTSCVEVHLVSDELRYLSNISLPKCKTLNLKSNHIRSFKDLPSCKLLVHLNLTENNITGTDGIDKLKALKTLNLTRNPISYSFDYRARIFVKLPNLTMLDGIPKLSEDKNFEYTSEKGCIIS